MCEDVVNVYSGTYVNMFGASVFNSGQQLSLASSINNATISQLVDFTIFLKPFIMSDLTSSAISMNGNISSDVLYLYIANSGSLGDLYSKKSGSALYGGLLSLFGSFVSAFSPIIDALKVVV